MKQRVKLWRRGVDGAKRSRNYKVALRWSADLPCGSGALPATPSPIGTQLFVIYVRSESEIVTRINLSNQYRVSSGAERSDKSATRKVLLICDLRRSPVTFYAGFILVILFGVVMRHESCLKPVVSPARATYKLDGSSWGISGPFTHPQLYDKHLRTRRRDCSSTLYLALHLSPLYSPFRGAHCSFFIYNFLMARVASYPGLRVVFVRRNSSHMRIIKS